MGETKADPPGLKRPGPPDRDHLHTPEAIAARLSAPPRANYLRDFIYGGIDGAITTFAVVAGVAGADLPAAIVLILGAANLLADGFSMAASNYAGTKAEADDARRLEARERRHIRVQPEGEREEIRQIFRAKGFAGADLERAVDIITADRGRWIETMLSEEYGIGLARRQPLHAALATFAAFLLCGAVPLLPYLLAGEEGFTAAAGMTAVTFFAIGSLKSLWSPARWWASGLETLGIGAGAAAIAYAAGWALAGVAGAI